jgi:hypothetical protein
MPPGYRPPFDLFLTTLASAGISSNQAIYVVITTDGLVRISSSLAGAANWLPLLWGLSYWVGV